MNTNEALDNIINIAGINFHKDDFLSREYAGFDGILKKAILTGQVTIPKTPEIENHFEKFPYFKVEDADELVGCIKIKFFKHQFKKSDLFQDYFEAYFQEAKNNFENALKTFELVKSCKAELNV